MKTGLKIAFALAALLMAGEARAAIDVEQMLVNISNVLGPYSRLVSGCAYLFGISLIFKALYHLKVYGEARAMMSVQTSLRTPLTYVVIGLMFMYLPTGIEVLTQTSFGYDSPLAYSEWTGPDTYQGSTFTAMFRIVQFVGLVAVVKGLYLLSQSAQQSAQNTFGKGVTHVIGGILAMNIIGTLNMLSATLGVSFY